MTHLRADIKPRTAVALVILVLLGAYLARVYRLDDAAPGLESDAADNLADALRISRGWLSFPLSFDTRPEPAYRYLLASWYALTWPSIFSSRVFQVGLGLLAIAIAYRAGSELLAGFPWQRLGAVCAAAALAGMTPYLFLSRVNLRAILLPLVVLAAVAALLQAERSRRPFAWLRAGAVTMLGLHAYMSGLVSPVWLAGYVLLRLTLPPKRERLRWREAGWLILGAALPTLPWLWLMIKVPDLYSRMLGASDLMGSYASPVKAVLAPFTEGRVMSGIWGSVRALFVDGYWQSFLNTPDTPFLNPPLALLALLGLGAAVWHWRRSSLPLVVGGLVIFILPAALSEDPNNPVRLSGTMGLVALLCGWGTAVAVAAFDRGLRRQARFDPPPLRAEFAGSVLVVALALVATWAASRAYQGLYADPGQYADPDNWLAVPWQNSLIYSEALDLLLEADQPTYVPLSTLDSPLAFFWLQRSAYREVTTWARYGLHEYPAGQVVYPSHHMWGGSLPQGDRLQALLLPDEGTIVLLPPQADGSLSIRADEPGHSQEVRSPRGWLIATVYQRQQRPLIEPPKSWVAGQMAVGDSLTLVGVYGERGIVPGSTQPITLLWAVENGHQPPTIQTFVQALHPDTGQGLGGSHDDFVLRWLYPSSRWQPGDLIPDVHVVQIDPDAPQGVLMLVGGGHIPPGQTRLPTSGSLPTPLERTLLLGALRVPEPQLGAQLPEDAAPADVRFADGISLVGYRLGSAGNGASIELYWRATAVPRGDYTIFVHAMAGDDLASQDDQRPLNGQLPTWAWRTGELVMTSHLLDLPGSISLDALYVGMYSYPSLERLAIHQSSLSVSDARVTIWSSAGVE